MTNLMLAATMALGPIGFVGGDCFWDAVSYDPTQDIWVLSQVVSKISDARASGVQCASPTPSDDFESHNCSPWQPPLECSSGLASCETEIAAGVCQSTDGGQTEAFVATDLDTAVNLSDNRIDIEIGGNATFDWLLIDAPPALPDPICWDLAASTARLLAHQDGHADLTFQLADQTPMRYVVEIDSTTCDDLAKEYHLSVWIGDDEVEHDVELDQTQPGRYVSPWVYLPEGDDYSIGVNLTHEYQGVVTAGCGAFEQNACLAEVRATVNVYFVRMCKGDIFQDGKVDELDLAVLQDNWGPCYGCPSDLNCDGVVDQADMILLLSLFGECSP